MNKSGFVSQEIDPEHVWINLSKGNIVCAAVLTGCGSICRGVYKLEDEIVSTVKEMVKYAEAGENIRFYIFYIIENVEEDK